jgi:type II secretory pathway pseudopilin PulG
MRFYFHPAYTLVELLIALALSLLLLLGVAELFQRVGGTMNETRSAMSASAHLTEAALLLRYDLKRIPDTLAKKPHRIANGLTPGDSDGYLEIIEGPDTIATHPYVDESGNRDLTVGDVDDIIAFALTAEPDAPFRGLIRETEKDEHGNVVQDPDGNDVTFLRIEERNTAEVIWFVRGNTLYRRVRLLEDDPSKRNNNMLEDLARREHRAIHNTAHVSVPPTPPISVVNDFPYPLYDSGYMDWYYLRIPIVEEFLSKEWLEDEDAEQWKTRDAGLPAPNDTADLWEHPHFFPTGLDRKSGAIDDFVTNPRNPRAGEDVVLTNVLSFDVKVWDPADKEFVDLGTGTTWGAGNQKQLALCVTTPHGQLHVWDSWTQEYASKTNPDPPYVESLEAIQITIRCFEPASRAIRQVTVVHRFKE